MLEGRKIERYEGDRGKIRKIVGVIKIHTYKLEGNSGKLRKNKRNCGKNHDLYEMEGN